MNKPDFITEEGQARRWAEGRGKGDGPNYITWLFVTEFSSRGFRTMLYSPKLGRVVHLFSLLELFVFIYAESHASFVEIKENFPLRRCRTEEIVRQKLPPTVKHPQVYGVPIVLTTDLLIKEEVSRGVFRHLAWSTKYMDELRNPRPVEKQQIEQLYHEDPTGEVPATFSIMTEDKLPMAMIHNLRYVRGTTRPGAMMDYSSDVIVEVDKFMRPRIAETPFNLLAQECSDSLRLDEGLSPLRVARYLIATRHWPVDLMVPIDTFKPLKLLQSQ